MNDEIKERTAVDLLLDIEDALEKVVEYNYDDEKEDYDNYAPETQKTEHIFLSIQRLVGLLDDIKMLKASRAGLL